MEQLLHALSNVLVQVVAPILVGWLVATIRKRYAIDIDEAQERRLREFARQGVAWAEEQARKSLKGSDSAITSGSDKLTRAITFTAERAKAGRLKKRHLDPQALRQVVEAELGRKRVFSGLTATTDRRDPN